MEEIKQSGCYCIDMRRAANRLTDFYDKALRPLGITVNQYSLIVNIHRLEPCSVVALAEAVRLEKSTLVRSLKPLLEQGLLQDVSAPRSRSRQIRLTDRGKKALERARPVWQDTQQQIKTVVGEDEVKQFMRVLRNLEALE